MAGHSHGVPRCCRTWRRAAVRLDRFVEVLNRGAVSGTSGHVVRVHLSPILPGNSPGPTSANVNNNSARRHRRRVFNISALGVKATPHDLVVVEAVSVERVLAAASG